MTKISIIVPVYNSEKTLSRCIDSLLNQTENSIEIILVDDDSTDKSLNICEQYRNMDERIVVISKKNGGPHSARKAGINVATSPYVTFVDADDWIENKMLSNMLAIMNEQELDFIACGHTVHEKGQLNHTPNQLPDGIYIGQEFVKEIYQNMLCPDNSFHQNLIPALWAKLFRTDKLREIMNSLDDDISIGEDLACTIKYVLSVNRLCIDNTIYNYQYYIHENSITSRYDPEYFNKALRLSKFLDQAIMETKCNYLEQNINRYKLYLIYREIGLAINADNSIIYKKYILDLTNISKNVEFQKIMNDVDIKKLRLKLLDKLLLIYLKEQNIFLFRMLCILMYLRHKRKG